MRKTTSSPPRALAPSEAGTLKLFRRLLTLGGIQAPAGTYERVWLPLLTLWYLIWQCLQPGRTLESVVSDARRGGVDRLSPKAKPLSKGIKSKATTAYSNARQSLPLAWVEECFLKLAGALASLGPGRNPSLPIELLDGSTKRLRPYGDIPEHFPPHRTRRQRSYWCVARVVVSFCAASGVATAALIGSLHLSEQALAVQLMLQAAKPVLYIGDRNFGVWRVTRAAVQSGAHMLARLTRSRARRLLGKKRLPGFLDLSVVWTPTRHDQVDAGLSKEPVQGRLVLLQACRPGFRPQRLYLFTTLRDQVAYPPERLLELYGWRWQAELNFRTIKSTMQMDQSETKSAEMVRKEFYAGLMAYNLVRGLLVTAAQQAGCSPTELSFAKVQGLLAFVLAEVFLGSMSSSERWDWLLREASEARLPNRKKARPSEPRALYPKPQSYLTLRTSRAKARKNLKNTSSKS